MESAEGQPDGGLQGSATAASADATQSTGDKSRVRISVDADGKAVPPSASASGADPEATGATESDPGALTEPSTSYMNAMPQAAQTMAPTSDKDDKGESPDANADDPLLHRADSYFVAVGGAPDRDAIKESSGGVPEANRTDGAVSNDVSKDAANGDSRVAVSPVVAASAGVAASGGGKGSGNGGNGKDTPNYTPPPPDALIRDWGFKDFVEFANVTNWSVARWKVQAAYWKTWFWEHRWEIYQDCLIGFAVALAQVPEAIAFAFVAGLPPIIGLYGTIVIGFVTSLVGGRPGMISGTSGAVGVVQAKLISDFNDMTPEEQQDTFGTNNPAEVVFATLLLMGGIEIMFGVLQIGRIVELVGTPIMIGFVNGLAMLIGRSQMSNFRRFNNETRTTDDPFFYEDKDASFVEGDELGKTLLLTFAAMATMFGVPVIMDYFTNLEATNACIMGLKLLFNGLSTVPPTLYAILVTLAINQAADLGTLTVEDKAIVKGEFISFHWPDVKWSPKMVGEIIGHAFIWSAVSMVEGVMTLTLLSEMIGNEGYPHQDMIAQGLGNFCCGLLRAQGGDAMIGQSLINVKSGGIRRRSGVLASVFIMIFLVIAYDFINIIPLGGLAGVMFVVVIFTFEWNTFRLFLQIPIIDSVVIVVVTLVTYFMSDLAIGTACGLAISCLHYAYTSGHRLTARSELLEDHDENGSMYHVKIYHVDGNLFFGSLRTLQKLMTPDKDPEVVILHLNNAKTFDMSAGQGLADMTDRYRDLGKDLRVAGLSKVDAKKLARIHHVTKGLTIDDYDKSLGDHHFERKREMRKQRKGVFGHIFGSRASYFNPESADVGQSSTLPQSWEAPHHHKAE